MNSTRLTVLLALAIIGCFTNSVSAKSHKYGFDASLASPYLNQSLQYGLLDVNKSIGKKAHYVLAASRNPNLANPNLTPLVIGNMGGPGVTSMWYLFKGMGVYTVDEKTGKVGVNNLHSVTNFAEYLLTDFPLGSGWSMTGESLNSFSDNDADFVLFMNKMSAKYNLINKQRPIHFHGTGFAGSLVSRMALALKGDGWNVKGALFTGAWVDSSKYLPHISQKLYDDGSHSWGEYLYWNFWGNWSKAMLWANIVGGRWATAYTALGSSTWFPWDGHLWETKADSRETTWDAWKHSNKFWEKFLTSTQLRTQLHGGSEKNHFWNKDVSRAMFYNTAQESSSQTVENLLFAGVNVVFMEGEYGNPTHINSQMEWINATVYAKKGLTKKSWVDTTFGAMKGWGNICVEKVTNSGSYVEFDQTAATYKRLRDMAVHNEICA